LPFYRELFSNHQQQSCQKVRFAHFQFILGHISDLKNLADFQLFHKYSSLIASARGFWFFSKFAELGQGMSFAICTLWSVSTFKKT
jgi:hypothetical protein